MEKKWLRQYVTKMLARRLSTYNLEDHLEATVATRPCFGNNKFGSDVEACLRTRLMVDEFDLDPASSLRYLNFGAQAWDRETEDWVTTRPDMLISRKTGWAFRECANPATKDVERALAIIRKAQDERGLHLPSEIPEEAAHLLDQACADFPELQFWHDFTREWDGTLYELTHLARGLFGVRMAEALYVRGSGRNGKDTVCNAMLKVGGSYVKSIACDSLCQITSADSPSPSS